MYINNATFGYLNIRLSVTSTKLKNAEIKEIENLQEILDEKKIQIEEIQNDLNQIKKRIQENDNDTYRYK